MKIDNAVVLVTSAGSRVGSTLAAHFSSLGALVILCDSDKRLLDETFQRCRNINSNVHQFALADDSIGSIKQLFQAIDHAIGQSPDILINTFTTKAIPNIFAHGAYDTFALNLSSMASTLFGFGQASAERMCKENKEGVIINVIGYTNYEDMAGLDNASSFVSGFTQSWAKELTPFNIRVGGVVPCGEANGQNWAEVQDEVIRNTEYIISNDYFSGRVMAA
ncbi:SDR family oxidoreductase [Vibrio panuliri]|uniref:Short-chain dehydrogenase n=1 Tax=Vibrio panuliri TaxID=1381081 RepID=A0A1Q9HJY4_9VIBR|nr:SDR family oxidoreductase [Vibrio panuliri]KAB1453807.1 SDR family oxidoreductase [Vibrio panuliri]OLQ90642.1 short-chain dehydrogenase [Vibrio panuliri]OLQ95911.1 short-chain dehydrogenase [Vibrio panuliri]